MQPTTITASLLAAALALGGCEETALGTRGTIGDPAAPTDAESTPPHVQGTFSPVDSAGGIANTFHHPEGLDGALVRDPREVLARISDEGPLAYTSRLHGCRKMRYETLGRMLESLGVDLASTEPASAGSLWRASDQALGAPNYEARVPETTELTTASASRLFDILVQAAPEILANLEGVERCRMGGVGVRVFDDAGRCTEAGLSCLLGAPATPEHVALCDTYASRATTPEKGRVLAVASILAAAATCE